MFKPLAMQHIELSLLEEDAPQAALLLANFGAFAAEFSEIPADQLPELPGEAYHQAYMETRAHLDKILAHYEIYALDTVDAPMESVSLRQLVETGSWLRTVWRKCSEEQERMRRLHDELGRARQLLRTLDQFVDISIDLALLQKKVSCWIPALARCRVRTSGALRKRLAWPAISPSISSPVKNRST
jgi:V/A-type H+-transporting ATPase subunit I